MVLEATMIIVDNSESSRNGDYLPTRFGAQSEAVNLIFQAKTQANPESAVGLMSMGGKGPEVLSTFTVDIGKILEGLHRTKISGSSHFSTAIQVAGLALRHRQNTTQRQRIIVFTCSPIEEDKKELVKLAKKMKKMAVSIDFIAFGDLDSETTQKLEAFNEAVTGGDGSHLAMIPPGPNLLSDSLVTTPILAGEGGMGGGRGDDGMGGDAGGGGGGGSGGFEFGVDPTMDPELAMALRMSFEEEQARLDKQRREQEEQENKSKLEGIPEEAQQNGEGSGSGGASGEQSQPEKKDDDTDKMDTA